MENVRIAFEEFEGDKIPPGYQDNMMPYDIQYQYGQEIQKKG